MPKASSSARAQAIAGANAAQARHVKQRVFRLVMAPDLEVQMRSGDSSRAADARNHLATPYLLGLGAALISYVVVALIERGR